MAGYTETAGSLTNTTVALAAKQRSGLLVGNSSDTVMTLRIGGTASATAGLPIPAGTTLVLVGKGVAPWGACSLFCAGTGKTYSVYEW